MFKFVADNVKGVGTKRKDTARPCDTCKRRHKRCKHNDQTASSPDSPPERLFEPARPDALPRRSNTQTTVQSIGTHASSGSQQNPEQGDPAHIRFVANLSPESAFITSANNPSGQGDISRHVIGLWLGQKPEGTEKAKDGEEVADDEQQVATEPAALLDNSPSDGMLLTSLRPALRRECLATLPPVRELALLSDLYFAKIDPIFPLLQDEPWEKHSQMESVALKQCICLIASFDPTMLPNLRLPHTPSPLPQIEFRSRIAAAIKQSLDLGFLTDQVVLLQVCTLMSMYVSKQSFGELSTHYCSLAVLHEQTLALHVGWPSSQPGASRSNRLFWCVWVLDRLNAATNGRPTLIHRRDMDRKVMDSMEEQRPEFRLLIRIAMYLDYAISLYRPYDLKRDEPENASDTFEGLVESSGAENLSNGLLASLELFYLSVVIIRGRPSSHRPPSELQSFCASRIVALASGEHKSSLVSWPILPYAVTVAASVAYRSLRNSPMSYTRRRAYRLFQESCEVLEELSKSFLSARAMARVGMGTVQEVERAAERGRRDSIRGGDGTGIPAQDATMTGSAPSQEEASVTHQMDQTQQQPLQVPGPPQSLDPGVAQALAALPTPNSSDQLDPSFFNPFDGEAGIFGNFDPSFDLGRIDAIFSANLDPSAPPFMERWPGGPGQFTWG